MLITSIGFSMDSPLSLFLFGIETLGMNSASIASLRDYDLVKGFLNFILATGVGEFINFRMDYRGIEG
jgi:hypothetical protein